MHLLTGWSLVRIRPREPNKSNHSLTTKPITMGSSQTKGRQ
jgi:hypothetical protein